jgi:hypothetical protein
MATLLSLCPCLCRYGAGYISRNMTKLPVQQGWRYAGLAQAGAGQQMMRWNICINVCVLTKN